MLVIDASGSMKKKDQPGFDTRMDAAKALAKTLVDKFYLSSTEYAARFSVVSFNETATLRVPWSTDEAELDAAIDAISADGKTSICAGLNLAGALLDDARDTATKVALLLTDVKLVKPYNTYPPSYACLPGQFNPAAAIAAGQDLNTVADKVFAWGFGDRLQRDMLVAIAGDESRVQSVDDPSELFAFLAALLADVCNDPPPN